MKKMLFLAFILIWMLITFSDSWEAKAVMPTERASAAFAVITNKIYLAGGKDDSGNYLDLLVIYDTNSDIWETKSAMNDTRSAPVACAYNEKVYVFGGFNDVADIASVEEYNPVSDAWTYKTPLPTPRADMIAEEVNGIIYVIGGQHSYFADRYDVNEAYDPLADTWVTKASMPIKNRGMGSAVYDGKIYVFGGFPSTGITNRVFVYDPIADTWEEKASLPTARRYLSGAALYGKIYALGGYTSSAETLNEVYDPLLDSWGSGTPMLTPKFNFVTASVDHKIYTIGGQESVSNFSDINEMYTPDILEISSTVTDDSACSNNGQIESGETISLTINLKNIIDTDINFISANLSTPDTNIVWINSSSAYPDISSGGVANENTVFIFHIPSNDMVDQIEINVSTSSDKGVFSNILILPVNVSIICNWYNSTDILPIVIPDNEPTGITSTIDMGEHIAIQDLNCFIDISHPYKGDLTVELLSPLGTKVRLHDETGASANDIYTIYDSTTVPDGPGVMDDFNDLDAYGTWTLSISDDAVGDIGQLNNWSINICQRNSIYPEIDYSGCSISEKTSDTFTVTIEDNSGSEIGTTQNTQLLLSSDSSGDYHFYSDAAGTNEITSFIIPNGQSRSNFYYSDNSTGNKIISLNYGYGDYFDIVNENIENFSAEIEYYEITASSPQIAGTGWIETAVAKDACGNTVYTDNTTEIDLFSIGNAAFYGDDAYFVLQSTAVLNSGIATVYIKDTKAETIQITVSDTNGKTGDSSDIIILPASNAYLGFLAQPANNISGNTFSVRIGLYDAYNNSVYTDNITHATVSLQDNPTSDTLYGTLTWISSVGEISFEDLKIYRAADNYSLKFESSGLSDLISSNFNILPAAADRLRFSGSPGNARAGETFTALIEILDEYGNLKYNDNITNVTVDILNDASDDNDATLYGTKSNTAASGIVNINDLYLDRTGAGYTIDAQATGLIADISEPFDITYGSPAKIVFIAPPEEVFANTLNNLSICLLDQFDQVTVAETSGLTILLNSSGSGSFQDDIGVIISVHIAEGESTAEFYYNNKICESDTIIASNLLLSPAECTLLINPSTDLDGFVIYPNPAKNSFISFENLTEDCTIKIYDLSGNLIFTYENTGGQNLFKWELQNRKNNEVASGIYFYVIQDEDSVKTGKIAVIK